MRVFLNFLIRQLGIILLIEKVNPKIFNIQGCNYEKIRD